MNYQIFEFDKENMNFVTEEEFKKIMGLGKVSMWIKDEDILINTDKVQILYMELYSNGFWKIIADGITIGSYSDEETCKKVFDGISKALEEKRGLYDMGEVLEKQVVDMSSDLEERFHAH